VPSPPAWNDGVKLDSAISPPQSPLVKDPVTQTVPIRPSPLADTISPRSSSSVGTDRSLARPYVSKIGILPSSLPAYHKDFMEEKRTGRSVGNPLSTAHSEINQPSPQTEAEKAETARRLNPHSRSQLKLDEANKRPAGMTPVPQKKNKPTKWQFGIRSRNQPLEAIGCIYRALQKLGAEWVVDEDWSPRRNNQDDDDG
jgi:carbon catabolite-derepressing protein kinase